MKNMSSTSIGERVGPWLSADPIGEKGGLNLYAYVGNSPINSRDPLGLVNMNLINETDPEQREALDAINRWNSKNGTFTVGTHGTACGDKVTDAQGKPLSPERLAELIGNAANYTQGQNVTLYMCNTGGVCPMGSNYAQRVAEALGVGVRPPNGKFRLFVPRKGPVNNFAVVDNVTDEPAANLNVKCHEPKKCK